MKNKLLLTAIALLSTALGSNAIADVSFKNSMGKTTVLESPFQSKNNSDGIPDILDAVGVGDLEFISKALEVDPELFKKFNSSNPEDIIGFNAYDLETLNVVLKSDPELLSRMQANQRNIASSMLFNHWDELTHKKDIDYFTRYEKTLKELGVRLRPGQTLLKKDRKLTEDMALATSANMPVHVYNKKDVFGNTVLHYAVGRNLPRLVNYLIHDSKFTVKSAFNNYGETAPFMLIDNSCTLSPEDKKNAQEILAGLIHARMSLFQKNISGFSFPALAYGLPGLDYLVEVLDRDLSPMHKTIFKKEAELVKMELGKGDDNKLYSSIQRNGYWTNNCRYWEDKDKPKIQSEKSEFSTKNNK